MQFPRLGAPQSYPRSQPAERSSREARIIISSLMFSGVM
jgi:hypothetical protein